MKKNIVLALLAVSFGAAAQEKSSVSRTINDDGKKLHIKIDVEQKGREVHYDRSFDTADMSKEEKEALVDRVQDSLGVFVSTPPPPRPPKPPKPPKATVYSSNGDNHVWVSSSSDYRRNGNENAGKDTDKTTVTAPDGTPYTKSVQEDPENGRLKLRYEFSRDGESHVYERTINTQGKSERDQQRIIEETERNLGLSKN